MKPINILEKFKLFNEHWTPKKIGELNGQQLLLAKLKGEFIWHTHEKEDELFFISLKYVKTTPHPVVSRGYFIGL